jgi:hypothetical protein
MYPGMAYCLLYYTRGKYAVINIISGEVII